VVHATPVEDSATLLIEYGQGTRGVVDVRWHSRVARDEFRIIGTDGEMQSFLRALRALVPAVQTRT
jgi:predicted dehydrogenase